MQYEHPHITVSSPAQGHYIIDGLPSGNTMTDEGRLVHPTAVHIPPTVPSDLLAAILEERGELAGAKVSELVEEYESIVPAQTLEERVTIALTAKRGRLNELAEALGVSPDEIRALDCVEIASGGWVKLKGGEA